MFTIPHQEAPASARDALARVAKHTPGGYGVRFNQTAIVACPECGEHVRLSGHEIGSAGEVTPSLNCGESDCAFYDFIQLEGWPEEGDDDGY